MLRQCTPFYQPAASWYLPFFFEVSGLILKLMPYFFSQDILYLWKIFRKNGILEINHVLLRTLGRAVMFENIRVN